MARSPQQKETPDASRGKGQDQRGGDALQGTGNTEVSKASDGKKPEEPRSSHQIALGGGANLPRPAEGPGRASGRAKAADKKAHDKGDQGR
jgi:hypothetical protein